MTLFEKVNMNMQLKLEISFKFRLVSSVQIISNVLVFAYFVDSNLKNWPLFNIESTRDIFLS